MTILVDVSLSVGAADTSQYWHIGNPVSGRIGTAKIAPAGLMTSYPGLVMALQVDRTSSRTVGPIVEYNAGTATITLLNDDGALDPAAMSEQAVGARIRLRYVHDSVTYPIFSGTITSLLPDQRAPMHAVVVIQAVDGFDDLENFVPQTLGAPIGLNQDTGARIGTLLDQAGWPTGSRELAVGKSTHQGTVLDGSVLSLIHDVVMAEGGEFYIDGDGIAVFRNRHAVLTSARSNTSQATFGSNRAGGELPFVGSPGLSNDRGQLTNTVRATRAGGTQQTASDAASVARHGARTTEENDLSLQTDSAALSWAKFVLRQNKDPQFRITSLTVDTRADAAALLPQALGRKLGDRITVVRRPPGGFVDSRELLIRSIAHTWAPPDRWRTTWGLQPTTQYSFFTIGHPVYGRIGRNSIAF